MQRRRTRRLCSAAVCAALVVAMASPSIAGQGAVEKDAGIAARDRANKAAVADVQRDLAESSEDMVQAAADLRAAEKSLAKARRTASAARLELREARRRQAATALLRRTTQTELMIATQRAEASALRVDEQRERLGRVARAAYQQGGTMGTVTAILEADSAADFTERLVAFDQVVTAQRSVLAELQDAERTTQDEAHVFESVRDRVAAAHEQALVDAEAVEELLRAAAAAELEVQQLVSVQRKALAKAVAAQAEDERRLLELRGESNRLTQQLAEQAQALLGAAGGRAGSSYPVRAGAMTWPVFGPVTSPYGMRVHPVTGVHKLHTGTDFGVACGTPIVAARAGSVIAAGFNRAYGWRTVVSHGVVDGALLTTTYNHQTGVEVEVGQEVKAGEVIGSVGSTGYSTGCHLHFELIINSDVVDPLPWLAAA